MSINCAKCGNRSKVVYTYRMTASKHRKTNPNNLRTRQCITCRWKWKTIERIYHKPSRM